MSMDTPQIAIIGAGASGLTAALRQACLGRKVTVFEHKDRAGIKLSVTGNGKCNFTNAAMNPGCFHESEDSAIGEFLKRFTVQDAISFLKSIGVEGYEKYGYYYPDSNKAEMVAGALVDACIDKGVEIRYTCGDIDINALRETYDKIILACGSRAHKETGSNGTGYKFLERLGIPYTRVLPALCALCCEDDGFFSINKGRRTIATVSIDGHEATGELQINDYGLSGIPVLNISRYASLELDKGEAVSVTVNFDPDEKDIPDIVKNRENSNSYKPVTDEKIHNGIRSFKVIKTASFDKSQVCTGGVSLEQLTEDFEVRSLPGVYVIGEMCDVDGICGGYNLHWAWLSGNLCAN